MAIMLTADPVRMSEAEFEIFKMQMQTVVGNFVEQSRLLGYPMEIVYKTGWREVHNVFGMVVDLQTTGEYTITFRVRSGAALAEPLADEPITATVPS